MPGPATKATATIKQPHSVSLSLSGRQWALGQKEANHRADITCAVTQVYLTPCREQIHTKQRGKKFSRQSKHLLQLQKPKLNDSARDRQRQRQKDEERESGKLTSLQNGIMRRKRSHWKGKCPWPERAHGKAKLELKLKLKETACSSHDSYGSEMEAELERDLETSKASDTVISRPTTPWNH